MFTLIARINIYSSSQRITRLLLFNPSTSFNTHQYFHSESHSQFNHYLVNLHAWKLTHQPHEPTLHWNPRFRQQEQQQQFAIEEQDQSSENWDLWFHQYQSPSLLPFSQDKVYFLDLPHSTTMPKRPSTPSPTVDISYKRKKYSYSTTEPNLPKRFWTHTNYEEHLLKSHYHHFNFI